MKKTLLKILKFLALLVFIILPIRYFVFQPFLVIGASMEPTFLNYDYLFIDEFTYHFKDPQRGEVVIFHPPGKRFFPLIKRIIALPGETIEIKNGKIFIEKDGKRFLLKEDYLANSYTSGRLRITLKENEYFLLGDNRRNSYDSRIFGPIERKRIKGKVLVRIFSFSKLKAFLKLP